MSLARDLVHLNAMPLTLTIMTHHLLLLGFDNHMSLLETIDVTTEVGEDK
jgi:hypothetical protein